MTKSKVSKVNASMFARIICDPASPPEKVSTRFFNEYLQIAFPNNVLISKFHDECAKVNSPSESGSEERGGVSRAH